MLHQIGVGALGPVFRTYEPNRDRLVAVKVFRLDVTPEQAAALAEELGRAANAGLFHSSIVEPVAAGVEGTVAYRAEEYVAAESLDVAMRHYAPATIDKALPFITQLASAIDFAREAGVGHGALHPRDIFVTPDEARATGFGVVDALERVGQRAPVRRPYSPPERIAGQPWNTSADVFSLAAIAFELLTGRRPSGLGENMGSLSGATLGDHADEVRAVLARGMNEKPAERYATARAFSAALAKAAAVEETTPSLADRTIVAAPAAVAEDPDLRIASDSSVPAALPELSLAAPLTTTPAASDILIKDAAASAVGSSEGAGDGLDDFGGEADSASSIESPRELARKMIAAREVRKRQVRKKPERPLNDLASEPQPSDVLKAEVKSDEPDIRPDVKPDLGAGSPATNGASADDVPAIEVPAKTAQTATAAVPVIAAAGLFDRSEPESVSPVAEDTPRLREVRPVAIASTDVTEVMPSLPVSVAELTPAATLEPTEVIPPPRDYSDRVVAVDEFRARESSPPRPDRPWPRIPDRPLNERPALDREPVVQRLKDEDFDSAIMPPAYEAASDGERPLVLQGALLASLCLMLGFGLGYVYRDRTAATAAQTTAVNSPTGVPRDEQQAPTTGKTPVPGTDVDVPVGGAKPAPPPAAPAPAVSNPKPVAPPAVVAKKAVPSAGRLVVTSSPAKASVVINGKWSGRTPLTLDDVKFGKYAVRIVQPGYEVEREQFVLSPSAATKKVEVTLRRSPGATRGAAAAAAPAAAASKTATSQTKPAEQTPRTAASGTGIMVIDSRPQGARVFIDGKDFGFTPLRLTAQPVGDRAVRLELANHHPWTNTAKVTAGEPTHVTGSLEPIR